MTQPNDSLLPSKKALNKVRLEPGMVMGMANVSSTLVGLTLTDRRVLKLQSSDDFVSFYGGNAPSLKKAIDDIIHQYSFCSIMEKYLSTNDSPQKLFLIVSCSPGSDGLSG